MEKPLAEKDFLRLLEEGLKQEPALRKTWLAGLEISDENKNRLSQMLGQITEAEEKLDATQIRHGLLRNPIQPGFQVGPFRVLDLIGSGGMGHVYLAERVQGDFEQKVAIKLLNSRLLEPEVLTLFNNERQILASLQHPNIASLFDGGTTADGIPYVVMEFVDGKPIAEYVSTHNLSIDAVLRLFKKVCLGVQKAHSALVIHRDIKPSNILVLDDGTPKLLDFGIAKTLSSKSSDVTHASTMTPTYASPEQLRGERLTASTDVYSLGVLLFELLVGEPAFAASGLTPVQLEKQIRGPGFGVASQRALDAGNHNRAKSLQGDLDTIIAKATSEDVANRYESAGALAEDIERLLQQQPVLAQAPTASYRLRKFVARNTGIVVATTLAFVGLISGLAVSLWQTSLANYEKQQANTRFSETRSLVNYLMNELYPVLNNVPGGSDIRLSVAKTSQTYLDNLSATRPEDPLLLMETAQGYRQLGDMQGSPQEVSLNQPDLARESYDKALALLVEADEKRPKNDDELALRLLQERADTNLKLARLLFMHTTDGEWNTYSAQAVKLHGEYVRRRDDFVSWLAYMDARLLDADIAVYAQDYATVETMLDAIIEDLDQHGPRWDTAQGRKWGATRMRVLGTQTDMFFFQERYTEALRAARLMVEAVTQLRVGHEDNIGLRRAAWVSEHKIAELGMRLKDFDGVVAACENAIDAMTYVLETDPADTFVPEMLAESYRYMGAAYSAMQQHAKAQDAANKAVEYYRQVANRPPITERKYRLLAETQQVQAIVHAQAGDADNACGIWRQTIDDIKRLDEEYPGEYDNDGLSVPPMILELPVNCD